MLAPVLYGTRYLVQLCIMLGTRLMKFVIITFFLSIGMTLPLLAMTTKKTAVEVTAKIRESLSKADKIFVYEGLPHQIFESALLRTEEKREDTLKVANFPFYKPQVAVSDKIAKSLKELTSVSESYVVFSGEKRCGGFHPDYALEWFSGDQKYSILFCYGCKEALIVDGKKGYRYNFKRVADLRKLLAQFKLKRPE